MKRKITDAAFAKAQSAESDNWAGRAQDAGQIRHEIVEHSEVAEPLRRVAGDRRFARGLEVGIGAYGLGFLPAHFADRVERIDGIDPLPQMTIRVSDAALQAKVDAILRRVRYAQARGEEIPAADGAYDLVSCINVVDHAQNPWGILDEISRVLAPGGVLVFSVNTLSVAGEWKWKLARALRPGTWLYVAHPHTFQWRAADRLVRRVPGEELWNNRPGLWQQIAGRGRMSFWILEKRL